MFLYFAPLGTYAVMSVMIGGVTERLAPDSDFMKWDNLTNTSQIDVAARDEERVRVAAAVTFISGLFQVDYKKWNTLVLKSNISVLECLRQHPCIYIICTNTRLPLYICMYVCVCVHVHVFFFLLSVVPHTI